MCVCLLLATSCKKSRRIYISLHFGVGDLALYLDPKISKGDFVTLENLARFNVLAYDFRNVHSSRKFYKPPPLSLPNGVP